MADTIPRLALTVEPKFALGNLSATANALTKLTPEDMGSALNRHASCDWGDLDEHDQGVNESSFQHGGRLFSVYTSVQEVRFYVITEADRSHSTILLPEDY